MASELDKSVQYLKGVGEQRMQLLSGLGISTLRDLVSYFPRAYEDRTVRCLIENAPLEQNVCIEAIVAQQPKLSRIRKGMELVKFRAVDESGAVDITYFNQSYVRDAVKAGETYIFYGKISGNLLKKTMTNPTFEPLEKAGAKTGRIVPVYRLCRGISSAMLSNYVATALDRLGGELPDVLPQSVCEENSLAQAPFAYRSIHFPADFESLELARRRLIFEELFVLACAMTKIRAMRSGRRGTVIEKPDFTQFYSPLSYSPTGAQLRAISEAAADMSSGGAMNRLVQGDVGSGKTLVAAACAWAVCKAGHQAAFMAPTEILAEQHLKTMTDFLAPFGMSVGLLTGSMTAKEKRAVKARLASGETDLIVGTHALLTADVEFSDLALVITDEQHRFGVEQRGALSSKGESPHVLVMSATPIPRTLALIIYGDLDVSVIDELPPGRQRVDTFCVDESYRPRLNGFIEKQAAEGRQTFVVCPMVEESEEETGLELKSAVEHAEELKKTFPKLRVGCIHGKMKSKDKESIMASVVRGELDILVSTTVIEVGVDVPNASLMVIENAERFGLSQLHQLRGRVGRGSHKSWCILVSDADNEEAKARLKAVCETTDGFKISEFDLRQRGPGDFFGSRQHGLPEMHIADLCGDMNVLKSAQDAAARLLQKDPALSSPENAPLLRRIETLFELRGEMFN